MRHPRSCLLWVAPILLAVSPVVFAACGGAPTTANTAPAASASASAAAPSSTAIAVAPEPPMPTLRTGTLQPIENAEIINPHSVTQGTVGTDIIVAAELPQDAIARISPYNAGACVVSPIGGPPMASAFLSRQGEYPTIWLKAAVRNPLQPLTVDVYSPSEGGLPGQHVQVRIDATAAKTDARLGERWAEALGMYFTWSGAPASAFDHFAKQRLTEVFVSKASVGRGNVPFGGNGMGISSSDLSFLMETTTGATSIQEALQFDRTLIVAATDHKPKVPIADLKAPPLAAHPFKEMLRTLGTAVPSEPLAAAVPAEFYYFRFADLPAMFRVIDQVDSWGTPIATALSSRGEDRRLSARYEAQLGIGRGPLTRALGPDAIGSIAVTGSDPYLREGSDVTIVFTVKNRSLFDAGMASALATHLRAHGKPNDETISYGGTTIRLMKSLDGVVRQHRASVGDLEFVSNSLNALKRVLDAQAGKRSRLSDEPDFQYMLARDASVPASVIAFMGDKFVAEVIGPRQKILEHRRQIALSELSAPGFAALLHGHVHGRSPVTTDELLKSGLLQKKELVHGSGEAITFQPGSAATSAWGSPQSLTPLIDLPEPKLVTDVEKVSYERFAEGYQRNWSTFIDPAMLRISFASSKGDEKSLMTADLRILPLIDSSEYRDISRTVGSAAVKVGDPMLGVRAVLGIGQEARIRKELGGFSSRFVGRDFGFDWLGDWAMVGAADRNSLAVALSKLEHDLPQRPLTASEHQERVRFDEIAELTKLPIYAAIGIKSSAGAAIALAAVRKMAEDVFPDGITWEKYAEHRGVGIVHVVFREPDERRNQQIELFYSLTGGALTISLKEDILRKLIDEQLDGRSPIPGTLGKPGKAGDPQLVMDVAGGSRGPIWTAMSWLLEMEALDVSDRARDLAGVLLRGAPENAANPGVMEGLSLAYFGMIPTPPDGGSYTLTPQGVRDPFRGTEHAPHWPAVPVPGSPVDRLLSNVSRFHSELSFDEEGRTREGTAMQSLHVRVKLGLHNE